VGGYYGSGYRTAPGGGGSHVAQWSLSAVPAGEYRVYASWAAHSNRASNAPFTVVHADGSDTVRVNQREMGGKWVLLGSYRIDAGSRLELSNAANGYVIADAIKLVASDAEPNSATWSVTLPSSSQYDVFARWTAHANRASNAAYSRARRCRGAP
jgi:hypothetical protein